MRYAFKKILLFSAACTVAAALAACGAKSTSETTDASAEASGSDASALTEPENLGTVTLGQYKGVDLETAEPEVSDTDVTDYIDSILAANPDEVEVDRAAEDGDIVNIDYTGTMNGEEFDGGSAQDYDLELGSGTFIDGFEDGLIGAKKGDQKTLNLKFPDTYANTDLAGKDVTFDVTVNAVKETKDAELTDEWVSEYTNGSITTVDDFKTQIKEELQKQADQSEQNLEMTSILQTVMDNSEAQISDEAIQYFTEVERQQLDASLSQYGMTEDDYLTTMSISQEDLDKQIEESAQNDAKRKLVIEAIAKAENLEKLTNADYKALEQFYGYSKDMLVSMAGQEAVDTDTLNLKVLNFLIDNANKVPRPSETAAETESESASAESDSTESGASAESDSTESGASAESGSTESASGAAESSTAD